MNGRFISAILLVLVLIAGAAGLGYYTYNAGVAQGLVDSGKLVAPATGVVPAPMQFGYPYGPMFFHRPFGYYGFGVLGCLVPILFIFLFFGLLRGMFGWRRHWGWGGHYGPPGGMHHDVPPMFEEWHKRAHGESSAPGASPDATTGAK